MGNIFLERFTGKKEAEPEGLQLQAKTKLGLLLQALIQTVAGMDASSNVFLPLLKPASVMLFSKVDQMTEDQQLGFINLIRHILDGIDTMSMEEYAVKLEGLIKQLEPAA